MLGGIVNNSSSAGTTPGHAAIGAQATLREKLLQAVKSDPKKTGILVILAVVLAGLCAKLTLNAHPATSAASPVPAAVPGLSGSTDNITLLPGGADGTNAQQAQANLQEWLREPIAPLGRNLFTIRLEAFPTNGSALASADSDKGFWDGLAKSMVTRADLRRERQILIANLQAEAAELKLQSIVMGPKPKAMVNGTLLEEGDVVANFRVLQIEPRGIVVEREGIRLSVQMN